MSEEIEKVKAAGLPAKTPDYGEDAGAGWEGMGAEDISVPYLILLNDKAKWLEPGDDFVPEAKAGMLVNSVTNQLYGAETIIVPCARQHLFVEWVPKKKGGGLVARHEPTSDFVRECEERARAAGAKFGKLSTEYDGKEAVGNDLVDTHYLWSLRLDGVDDPAPAEFVIVACNSTKIKPLRGLNTVLTSLAPPGQRPPPMYANRVRVWTAFEKRAAGNSFNFRFGPAVDGPDGKPSARASLLEPGHPVLLAGRNLAKMVRSGDAAMAEESVAGHPDDDGDVTGGAAAGSKNAPF